jgi:hypothetical protein
VITLLLAAAAEPACVRRSREPLLTYFSGDHGLTVRYPASWKTEEAEQDGVWYRYFLGPPSGDLKKSEVSVTLLAGPLGGALDEYAQSYLTGNRLTASREEERQGARGRAYAFLSNDGAMRYSLLLLADGGKVYGLYAQGEAAGFERHAEAVQEMEKSLTLERPAFYLPTRDPGFGFSLRLPRSWKETRRFSSSSTLLLQYTSPPLLADRGGQTAHSSLTLTVEPLGADPTLEGFYQANRLKLADAFRVLSHNPWGEAGYVDVLRTETPVSVSRVKRYYRVEGARGYSLSFEAREDVYPRVFRWYELIASTLRTGGAMETP